MRGARLFAILLAFIVVVAAALTIVATSDLVIPRDPGASSLNVFDRILGLDNPAKPKPSARERALRKRRPRTYRVKNNETPTRIAKKFGLRVSELRRMNRGVDVLVLQKGQKLNLR